MAAWCLYGDAAFGVRPLIAVETCVPQSTPPSASVADPHDIIADREISPSAAGIQVLFATPLVLCPQRHTASVAAEIRPLAERSRVQRAVLGLDWRQDWAH